MSKSNDFYIGWNKTMSDTNERFLKKRLIPLFIGIPIICFLLVFAQRPFNSHQFEYGNNSEITGTYYHTPFPMLIADKQQLPQTTTSDNILLVGYGKLGAKENMEVIQKANGNLQGKKITLQGTLIYGDGKTLMELSKGDKSLVRIENPSITTPTPRSNATTPISVKGEILDPKCYFGVMKPGEGKIHKSCAIRCISGGIPPVFKHSTGNADKPFEYFLMLGTNGETINKAILPYVAEDVTIKGQTNQFLDWKVLYLDPDDIKMNVL